MITDLWKNDPSLRRLAEVFRFNFNESIYLPLLPGFLERDSSHKGSDD